MKKLKIFNEVFSILLVLVPIALLAGGLWLSTGPIWDALMLVGIVGIVTFSIKKYRAVCLKKENKENARAMVAIVATCAAFFALVAQLIFCRLGSPAALLTEAAMVWMFILMAVGVSNALNENMPNRVSAWGIIAAICWILICAMGGIFDIYEYFSGQEIPERLGNLCGTLASFCGIAAFILLIIGIWTDKKR
ncbi:MAG: hypothetical protein IKR92_03165 [Alphaproteobacteria bacterium]|nr:hypothetical protein [Alphaproteobacteria bacterium]